MNIENQFLDAIAKSGLVPPPHVVPDGMLHRFSSNGKPRDSSGWYVLHGDGTPAGSFGCWRAGLVSDWCATPSQALTPEQIQINRQRVEQARRQRDEAQKSANAKAAEQANKLLAECPAASPEHPYLVKKQVKPHGICQYEDVLLVPMQDVEGKIWNVERIYPDGTKKGLAGGKRSGLFYMLGEPAQIIAICEGFATGASIHEATGLPVAIAFNAGNLLHVAKTIRQHYPQTEIILCGDDDWSTEGNPGRAKAEDAARMVSGRVVLPEFGVDRQDGWTDFNDLHVAMGLGVVKDQILNSLASNDARLQPGIPEPSDRPCFRVFDDSITHDGRFFRSGVWHFGVKHDRHGEATLTNIWVCAPLHVEAITSDQHGTNFGRLLRFRDTLGRWREWSMPMNLLAADGVEMRSELLDRGLEIDPKAKNLLSIYVQADPPERRLTCSTQTGWNDRVFLLPNGGIGEGASDFVFQSAGYAINDFTAAGSVEGWIESVGKFAAGNPILLLSLSAAFAAPLMKLAGIESGGVHLVGDSSTGKTTALDVAASVWGGESYKRSWRATSNGLEAAASTFNDCLLCLDEISECDPREIGAIVYALGNGRGKQRASRTGSARAVATWRSFILSTGERTVETSMLEGGRRPKAGQSIRLLDIPCSRTFGAWDDLHGFANGVEFSDHLKRSAKKHHGYIGRAYLERLTRDGTDFTKELTEDFISHPMLRLEGGSSQEQRAATRFGVIAMAGELASRYGLTGWRAGMAIEAAGILMHAWRDARGGGGNDESRTVLGAVRDFIDRHGDARFTFMDASPNAPAVRDRAGWTDGETYYFTGEGLREATKGYDFKRVLQILSEAGWLPKTDTEGKTAKVVWVGGKPKRLYPIKSEPGID